METNATDMGKILFVKAAKRVVVGVTEVTGSLA